MPKTFGVAAHAAGVGGDADPSRLRVAPSPAAVPLEEWRERMAAKAAEQAALRQRTRAAANAPAAAAHPPLESAAAKRLRRDREIVAAYSSDPAATLASVAARFGVGTGLVSGVLAAAGVPVRRGRRQRTASRVPADVPVSASAPVPMPEPARVPEPEAPAAAGPEPVPAPALAGRGGRTLTAFRAERVQRTADAVAAYLAGETVNAVATRFHLQKAFVRQQLRDAGVALRDDRHVGSGGMNAKPAAADDPTVAAAIVEAYAAGQTIASIVATVPGARSPKHVSNLLRRHGVQLRPSATGAHSDAIAKAVRNEQIVAAWHATPRPTQTELAARFHVTSQRVSQILAAAAKREERGGHFRPDPLVPSTLRVPVEPDEPAEVPALPDEPVAVAPLSLAQAVRATSAAPTPAPASDLTAALPEDVRRAIHDVVCGLMDAAAGLAGAAKGMSQLEAFASLLVPVPTSEGARS